MQRLVVVLVIALIGVAVYAVTAPASQQAVSPKRVAALEKKVKSLQGQLACLKTYAPLAVYGDPSGTAGYRYVNPDQAEGLTTAIDVTAQGDTADFNAATVKQSCISSGRFGAIPRPAPARTKPAG